MVALWNYESNLNLILSPGFKIIENDSCGGGDSFKNFDWNQN